MDGEGGLTVIKLHLGEKLVLVDNSNKKNDTGFEKEPLETVHRKETNHNKLNEQVFQL